MNNDKDIMVINSYLRWSAFGVIVRSHPNGTPKKSMEMIMSRLIVFLFLTIFSVSSWSTGFVDPSKFKGSENEKGAVISFIQLNVEKTYSAIGMGDPATLRMMEKEELNSFKALTKAENLPLLSNVINQYCGIGMCNYSTILMMYNEQLKASQQKLDW